MATGLFAINVHALHGRDKITICKAEIGFALKALDPRSHFNIVSFGTRVRTWKKNPLPASRQNVEAGQSWVRNLVADGETNYCDALRAVLDLGERADASPNFHDTPDTITLIVSAAWRFTESGSEMVATLLVLEYEIGAVLTSIGIPPADTV